MKTKRRSYKMPRMADLRRQFKRHKSLIFGMIAGVSVVLMTLMFTSPYHSRNQRAHARSTNLLTAPIKAIAKTSKQIIQKTEQKLGFAKPKAKAKVAKRNLHRGHKIAKHSHKKSRKIARKARRNRQVARN